jgi:hypothetical protein
MAVPSVTDTWARLIRLRDGLSVKAKRQSLKPTDTSKLCDLERKSVNLRRSGTYYLVTFESHFGYFMLQVPRILELNCIMTNVIHKFLIYLYIYFCLTCFGLSFSPSSEAGVQLRRGSSLLGMESAPGRWRHAQETAGFVHLLLKMG